MQAGDFTKAVEHFDTSMEIEKAVHGETEDHPNIARSYHNKAWVSELTGQLTDALTGYEKALKMARISYENLQGKHPDIAKSLFRIGECLRKQQDLEKAQENLRQAKNLIKVPKSSQV